MDCANTLSTISIMSSRRFIVGTRTARRWARGSAAMALILRSLLGCASGRGRGRRERRFLRSTGGIGPEALGAVRDPSVPRHEDFVPSTECPQGELVTRKARVDSLEHSVMPRIGQQRADSSVAGGTVGVGLAWVGLEELFDAVDLGGDVEVGADLSKGAPGIGAKVFGQQHQTRSRPKQS